MIVDLHFQFLSEKLSSKNEIEMPWHNQLHPGAIQSNRIAHKNGGNDWFTRLKMMWGGQLNFFISFLSPLIYFDSWIFKLHLNCVPCISWGSGNGNPPQGCASSKWMCVCWDRHIKNKSTQTDSKSLLKSVESLSRGGVSQSWMWVIQVRHKKTIC